jgi:hypothetical protein
MRKITVASAVGTVVTASALWAGLMPASSGAVAGDLCYDVTTGGSLLGAHTVHRCVNYEDGAICEYRDAWVGQLATVSTEACVPAP